MIDDGMEDRDAGSWLTVASTRKKRNKAAVVMKLEGTSSSIRKGSLRQNFVDKTCIFENDMSGVEVGKVLLRLSPDGINDVIFTLPPGVVDQFMSLQSKFKTIHEIQTSSSSSSAGEGELACRVLWVTLLQSFYWCIDEVSLLAAWWAS